MQHRITHTTPGRRCETPGCRSLAAAAIHTGQEHPCAYHLCAACLEHLAAEGRILAAAIMRAVRLGVEQRRAGRRSVEADPASGWLAILDAQRPTRSEAERIAAAERHHRIAADIGETLYLIEELAGPVEASAIFAQVHDAVSDTVGRVIIRPYSMCTTEGRVRAEDETAEVLGEAIAKRYALH